MADVDKIKSFKDEGNVHYKDKDYAQAIAAYSKGVAVLPLPEDSDDESGTPAAALSSELRSAGAVILCNRAAAYMGDNKAIPALADAQRASDLDPSNWKAHWRTGLALMMMKPRLERSEQAVAAFERTRKPAGEHDNVDKALAHAKYRLKEGQDSLDMPDMSNCVIS